MPALPQSVFVTNTQVQELLKVGYSKLIVKTYNGVLTIASIARKILKDLFHCAKQMYVANIEGGDAALLEGT